MKCNGKGRAKSNQRGDTIARKLGAFFLGKTYDADAGKTNDELLLYDSKDLTTHAVVVGMTGSGKTGLCIDLLEEASLDRVPSIVIDPKGDIANLLLTFPGLSAEEFKPWVDESQAMREGMSVDQFASAEAKKWKKGLESWGQTGERIQKSVFVARLDQTEHRELRQELGALLRRGDRN